ncbi:MAG: hypothetical protein LBP53_04625 [Candidatus Peribacteria bacterium]|jgi:hypothetical protein|nr:hypothetical protein [Candidatus Peribacteria bacterium]
MTDDVITKTEKEFETTEKEFTNEWENLQTLQQVTTSNRDILNKKIGDNKRKIEALENEIYNWDTQTETIIQQQKNKKDYSDKSITDYRSSRMTIKKGKQEELKRLKTTQQALDRAIKSPDFLQQHTETEINTFIQNLEAQQQSSLQSTTTGEYQKTEYEQI